MSLMLLSHMFLFQFMHMPKINTRVQEVPAIVKPSQQQIADAFARAA